MKKQIRIIGVPMDLGQSHRGVDMGPSAVRYANLSKSLEALGYKCLDNGDITIPGHYALPDASIEKRLPLIKKACESAYELGRHAIEAGDIPIFLGGDHSASIGTVGGVTHDCDVGLIWIDAHGDFNTPATSNSQNVHGMALATLLGQGPAELVNVGRPGPKVNAAHTVMIGLRDLDAEEKVLIKKSGCTVFTMRDVDELGIRTVLTETLKILHHLKKIHISFDVDVMDPLDAPGVGTPSQGGLTYREGQLVMEILADTGKLHSVDIMEINPILDIQNRTAQMAVNLLASLFGKKII
jgi:arginase